MLAHVVTAHLLTWTKLSFPENERYYKHGLPTEGTANAVVDGIAIGTVEIGRPQSGTWNGSARGEQAMIND